MNYLWATSLALVLVLLALLNPTSVVLESLLTAALLPAIVALFDIQESAVFIIAVAWVLHLWLQ